MDIVPLSDGTGVVQRLTSFYSSHITPRHVDIWLPPGYAEQPEVRYPVLYMHDGQNLFDPALAYIGVDWGMDEAVLRWMERTGSPGAIVVGIWNSPQRVQEYMPQRLLDAPGAELVRKLFAKRTGGSPCSDAYLRFLVQVVLPISKAPVMTVMLFGFTASWNAFQWPLLVTTRDTWRPLMVGLYGFITEAGPNTHLLMAGAVITIIPILIMYFLTQKQFTQGIATTGLKG